MGTGAIQRSLAAGELAPALHARADLTKYAQGLRTCRNFLVRKEGGAANRPGLVFVGAAKTNDAGTRVFPFIGPTVGESCLIEMGEGYLRFFRDGAPVRLTGIPAFDDTVDYALGDVVSSAGTNYVCLKETSETSLIERLAAENFDSAMMGLPISDNYPQPESAVIAGVESGSALRFTWQSNSLAPAFCYYTRNHAADMTKYVDGVSVTDAATFAPWVRLPVGSPVTQVAIYLVTANWDATKSINTGGKNTSAYALVLDGTKLRLGTPSMGSWFRPTASDGSALTRADWTTVGTPNWATVAGVIVQVYTPADTEAQVDLDDLALYEPHTGTRPPTPAPPDADYWYALTDDLLELPTPYTLATLPWWDQQGNTVVLTSTSHPPYELVYIDSAHWALRPAQTRPSIEPPLGLAGTAGAAGTLTRSYVVAAAKDGTYEESKPSAPVTVGSCAAPTAAAPVALTWDAVADAAEYYIYCDPSQSGTYGYVGTATGVCAFNDTGDPPDFETTPVQSRGLFAAAGDYPSRSGSYQQRRIYAGSTNAPDEVFLSRVGLPGNFGISRPLLDDDAVTFTLSGNRNHPVRWAVALKIGVFLGTDGGVWSATGGGGPKTPITPSSLDAEQETYTGVAPELRPLLVGNTILYVQARGSVLRELKYQQESDGMEGRDLSIWASHLFERQTIVALDYQEIPHSIVWAVRSDGTLLGLTYIPEQDIWGWHRHDTLHGAVEDVAVVPEDDEDVLYLLVARTIGGATVRYIERMARRELRAGYEATDGIFLDSALTYSGAPATEISGLDHLEGETVNATADGVTVTGLTVTAGAVTLPTAASVVHVGLPITADLETLDLDTAGASIRDKKKIVKSLTVLFDRTARTFEAGPDADTLAPFEAQEWEDDAYFTGPAELSLPGYFSEAGRVFLRVTAPVPVAVLGLIPSVEIGG